MGPETASYLSQWQNIPPMSTRGLIANPLIDEELTNNQITHS